MTLKSVDAWGAYRQKERDYNQALRVNFPPGTTIKWEFGGKTHVGMILEWGFGPRLKVESSTGKQYWLNAWHIISWLILQEMGVRE